MKRNRYRQRSRFTRLFPLLLLTTVALPVYLVLSANRSGIRSHDKKISSEKVYDKQHFQMDRYLFMHNARIWKKNQQKDNDFNSTGRPARPGKYKATKRVIRIHPNMLYIPALNGWIREAYTSAASRIKWQKGTNLPIGSERIDKWYSVPARYRPTDLTSIPAQYTVFRTVQLRKDAVTAFVKMAKAAAKEKVKISAFSGFRSWETQLWLYKRRIKIGKKLKQRAVARPGHSEHHLGTAVDVVGRNTSLAARTAFKKTKAAKWLKNHCWRFGFVLSYSDMNTQPSGYIHESWHLRYLGRDKTKEWIKTRLRKENAGRILKTINN